MRKDHRSGLEKIEENGARTLRGLWQALRRSPNTLPVLISAAALIVLAGVSIALVRLPAQAQPAGGSSAASAGGIAASQAQSYEPVKEDDDYDASAQAIDTEAFSGTVLPETDDAGSDYIKNTLFIGDSNCYRYMNYGFCTLENNISLVGLTAEELCTKSFVMFKNSSTPYTVPKAVAIMQPQRIIIAIGTNNLTGSASSFVKTYAKAIQTIYEAYPYCDIIVNAIPPVDKNRSYTNVTMQQVDAFNEALVQMCQDNGWKFLNSSEALKDPATGFCKKEYTVTDGLHLSKEGCTALFNYIRTHAFETADRRPKPLKSIPKRAETPPDIITKDPLKSDQPTKVDVTFVAGDGGTLAGETEQSLKPGSVSGAVTAVPNEGFEFAGWTCAYSGVSDLESATITYTVPSDAASYGGIFITASFKPIGYQVKFMVSSLEGGAFVERDTTNQTVTVSVLSGKTATAVLRLAEGYTLAESTLYKAKKNADGTYTLSVENVTSDLELTVRLQKLATATPSPSPSPSAGPSASPDPSATPGGEPSPTPGPTPTPGGDPTPDPGPTPEPADPTPEPADPTPEPADPSPEPVVPTEAPAAPANSGEAADPPADPPASQQADPPASQQLSLDEEP